MLVPLQPTTDKNKMASFGDQGQKELTVTFQPPLYLQRRGWVFDLLRREGIETILDVGCGEGELIACLCNPAPWLLPPPTSLLETLATPKSERPIQPEPYHESNLHPMKVLGLDVSLTDLQHAIENTAPMPPAQTDSWSTPTRWEPLEVKIWHGRLECVNPEFIGVECIVCTEVIEHLPEETLQEFAPILLGIYHPQFLLITTPSYTFNARFTPPESPASLRSGYPDPTGRTTRIFRHHDHKFEWTVEEFTAWCKSVAGEWGYDVEIGGVGKAQEKDEWERDDELGYASQVAAFRRREGDQYDRQRRERCSNLGIYQKTGARERHNLLITHHHVASKHARQPKSLLEIGETVKAKMLYYQESTMSVAELWFEKDIGFSCGGWIEVMTLAVEEHEALHLSKVHSEGIIKLKVQLLAETQSESVLRPVGVPMEEGKDHDFPVGLLEVSPVEEQPVWGDVESQWGPFLPITQGDTVSVAEDTDSLSQVCSHGWSLAETSEQVWDSIEGWSRLEKVITTGSDSVW